jgi:hypothetical protein
LPEASKNKRALPKGAIEGIYMKIFRLSVVLGLMLFGTVINAAPPHSVTYTPAYAAPGTIVTIQGTDFVVVTIGIKEFTNDNRYFIRFLAPLIESEYVNAVVEARHSTDPLPNSNATISSFPAQIEVSDGRSYSVNTTFDSSFDLTNRLQVIADATLTVQVKVGDTLLIGSVYFTHQDQDDDLGPGEYKAHPKAKYLRYGDPTNLITGLDRWVDYIAIVPQN